MIKGVVKELSCQAPPILNLIPISHPALLLQHLTMQPPHQRLDPVRHTRDVPVLDYGWNEMMLTKLGMLGRSLRPIFRNGLPVDRKFRRLVRTWASPISLRSPQQRLIPITHLLHLPRILIPDSKGDEIMVIELDILDRNLRSIFRNRLPIERRVRRLVRTQAPPIPIPNLSFHSPQQRLIPVTHLLQMP